MVAALEGDSFVQFAICILQLKICSEKDADKLLAAVTRPLRRIALTLALSRRARGLMVKK